MKKHLRKIIMTSALLGLSQIGLAQFSGETVTISGTGCTPGGQAGPVDQNYSYIGDFGGTITNFGGITSVHHAWLSDDGLNAIVSDDQGNYSITDANLGIDVFYTATGTAFSMPPCNGWVAQNACAAANPISISGDCQIIAPQVPEIAVKQAGTDITSGSSSVNFGTYTIDSDNSTLSFTIENEGTGDLSLTGGELVALTGDLEFKVKSQPQPTVGVAGSTTFELEVDPGCSPGSKTATVTILNNDADEGAFTFTVSAMISDASVAFGEPAYCTSDSDPTGEVLGVNGASFSSTTGLSISSNGVIDLSASTPSVYTVNISTQNCPDLTGTTVEIKASPSPTITGTMTYCQSDGSTALSADQVYDSYGWSSGGSSMTESVTTANNPISLTVTSNGCSGTSVSVQVMSIANPTPSITGTLSFCESDGSTALSADQSYDSYSWSSGGSSQSESLSTANNPISLTVTSNGCSGTSVPVQVMSIANPTPSITGTLSFCESDGSTTLSADQSYDSYSWSSGGSSQSESLSAANNPISLTVTQNGCSGTSQAVNVTAIANPMPSITGTLSYCESDGSTALSADQSYDSYSWSSGGSSQSESLSTANNPISLTVTQNGCVGTSQAVNVTAIANPMPSITGDLTYCESVGNTTLSADQSYDAYSWSSGGTGMEETVDETDNSILLTVTLNGCSGTSENVDVSSDPCLGLSGSIANQLTVYPNPVSGNEVSFDRELTNVSVINLEGVEVLSNERTSTLSVEGLSTGMYIIKSNEGVARFIKK